ncbi:GIY-YIG nuclease family protein [Chromatium okenii]|jgi:hypothetical protein|uniref:Bacteriophage T5 Orf172 DNA-binding domain-containing protein n=1 Tax=Chromatium okenii TaxID=61644 RepID=A0A2S7XS87_9GAMM|nr:GIY-YIG nuclease family protein [Chromatium okenii]MBV5309482.1 GIY-YIG nuclease family protein [Chromatium okenii]PQJ96506.1 hypothetical protein CXB77_06610 [Chromatium okenii]
MAKGFIYICRNMAMPGLLKIGYSVKVPTERVDELFTTGVPEPFKLEYYCLAENAKRLETQIHQNLSVYRHRADREFFRIELENAIQSIANLCKPEHEWRDEQYQPLSSQIARINGQKINGITIVSRHDSEREITEMINFSESAYQQSLASYVYSLFYDSNSCCCNFEFANEVEQFGYIADDILEIALETISQFEWFGQIQHGKPLTDIEVDDDDIPW